MALDSVKAAQMHEKLEAERAKQKETNKLEEYWMRCPKCGSALREESYTSVMIDRCTNESCSGIYLDRGEPEILIKAEPTLFWNAPS